MKEKKYKEFAVFMKNVPLHLNQEQTKYAKYANDLDTQAAHVHN